MRLGAPRPGKNKEELKLELNNLPQLTSLLFPERCFAEAEILAANDPYENRTAKTAVINYFRFTYWTSLD